MGESSVTTGRILSYSKDEHEHNLKIVSSLPSQEDGYSLFSREMFCQNSIPGKMSYVFGFARSYKNAESYWKDWILEFEELLRVLKWNSVNVLLETEMFGTHQYFWQNKFSPGGRKQENSYGLIEKEEWYFGKGFRNFWGMPKIEFGFDKLGDEVRTINRLIKAIDSSLEGLPARFKIFEDEKRNLELLASSNGFKKFISNLLKHYVNMSVKNTSLNEGMRFETLDPLVHEDSPKKISKVSITSSHSNTEWIHEFIDGTIDSQK